MNYNKNEKARNLKYEFAKELGAYDIFKYGGWAAAVSSPDTEEEIKAKNTDINKK